MGHDLPDIEGLILIVYNGSDPILIAAHIEHCVAIDIICRAGLEKGF